jgi:peptidoglycan/xylan/chitin deacetylase (PgdA/CDA1 family)
VVALTFDAGANADGVPVILAALRARHIAATFFLTGNFVRRYPVLSRQMAAAGTVGDHTVTHPHMPMLTDGQIKEEVLAARSAIIATTGRDPRPFFRFPYGESSAHTVAVVNAMGFIAVGWTVDSLGWKGTSGGITVASVVNRVVTARTPGEIVLMHVGSNPNDHSALDAAALPTVISRLTALGYEFVALDALLR